VADLDYLIIGAGFGGIGMAIKLRQRDQQCRLAMWEKANDLGGCWRDNHYPGAACDVPSHLYSYSFALNPNWSHKFAPYDEIHAYIKRCAQDYKIAQNIEYQREVKQAVYNESTHEWQVTDTNGHTVTTRYLITATGQLNQPAYPNIKGIHDFEGSMFHSARWEHDVDLSNKNVAVIGTGASAIQFVPEIAKQASQVHIYQRSAPYVIPKPDRPYRKWEQKLFNLVPPLLALSRLKTYIQFESRFVAFRDMQFLLKPYMTFWRYIMRKHIKDPVKRQQLTPDYIIGCKRILISNNFYPTLNQDHVSIIDNGIKEISKDGIIDNNGDFRKADVIILGTGFKATEFLSPMHITGKNGLTLNQAWKDGAEAYLGMCIHDFPNLFVLYGPNTNLGHNSIIYMLESQFRYVLSATHYAKKHGLPELNVKANTQGQYNRKLQEKIKHSVWEQGCNSWYKTKSGKHTNNWPGFTLSYRWLTKYFKASDFTR